MCIGIVADQPVGVARADGGDPPLQRGTATVVPAQRLVQAVAGAVLTQEQPGGGNTGMPGEPAGLRPVDFEGLDQTAVVEAVDHRTGQELLNRDDRVSHLGHQLGASGTGQPARRSTRLTVSGPASMSATRCAAAT